MKISVLLLIGYIAGCAIKVDVTSQRTALENQVMGSYQELDDDLVLNSSVRADGSNATKDPAFIAKQNQAFNKDDIDELKTKGLIGETRAGLVKMISKKSGPDSAAADKKLAKILVEEENRDRKIIWKKIISSNKNLNSSNLKEVQKTYATMIREKSRPGHWFESEKGAWKQAVDSEEVVKGTDESQGKVESKGAQNIEEKDSSN